MCGKFSIALGSPLLVVYTPEKLKVNVFLFLKNNYILNVLRELTIENYPLGTSLVVQ